MSSEAHNPQPDNYPLDLADKLRTAVSKGNGTASLDSVLQDEHPLDIAEAIKHLKHPEVLTVFNALDDGRAMEVLDRASPETTRFLAEHVPTERLETFLCKMPNRKKPG